tara:strand:- start:413 stop:2404 length:1992 start_codon:yes stop_codon:yes gene_type:complete
MDVKKRIQKLVNILNHHNTQYYVHDNPVISDSEYDLLLKELESLEKSNPKYISLNSPTQRIGSKPLSEFKTVKHSIPMQSLANAMNLNELEEFDTQIKKLVDCNQDIEYIAEPKLDGLAVELVYEKGEFKYGSTRGDGINGEDITQNLKTIKGIPLFIDNKNFPSLLEIRGEVFINHNDFKELNKNRIKNNESAFANPRNCAAGSLRQLNFNITKLRPLRIFCYAPGLVEGYNFNTQQEFLSQILEWGFPVNSHTEVGFGLKFLKQYYQNAEKLRKQLSYDIDGVVFKVNSYDLQNKIGVRSKSPRWAIAGKFKAQQATTKISNIIISVGRTGALTPVAQLVPVKVGGVIISNATLHNQDEINRKDIRIGDTVLVQRAGDVIPEVVKVIIEKRNKNSILFNIPDTCPVCNSFVMINQKDAVRRCNNYSCPAIIQGKVDHFVSKQGMNIDGMGPKIVKLLIDNNLIKNISDIFKLQMNSLISLERIGEKSANNIVQAIDKARVTTLARFIYALGIRNVGQNAARLLDEHYNGNIALLMNANKEELVTISDIGEIMADSIIQFFSIEDNITIISNCLDLGVKFYNQNNLSGNLNGKRFLLTGSLNSFSRSEAKEILEKNGAIVSSSISKKLDYIIVGDNPGSKLEKGKKLNIEVLLENDFLKLLD